jgi:hypothetical protein
MTWLPIYKAQSSSSSRAPHIFDKEMLFQIKAEVVNNPKWQDSIDGMVEDKARLTIIWYSRVGLVYVFTSPPVIIITILNQSLLVCCMSLKPETF